MHKGLSNSKKRACHPIRLLPALPICQSQHQDFKLQEYYNPASHLDIL